MDKQVITRSTVPPVVDLQAWREKYAATRAAERAAEREHAINAALRYAAGRLLRPDREAAAAVEHALRLFRDGCSAASAIQAGKARLVELGWGDQPSPAA